MAYTGDISRFGSFYRTRSLIEARFPEETKFLQPQEDHFIRNRLADENFDVKTAYLQHLNVDIEAYFEVRKRIMTLLQVWDAMIGEKKKSPRRHRTACEDYELYQGLSCHYANDTWESEHRLLGLRH